MIISHEENVETIIINNPEAKGASMKAIVSPPMC